MIINTGCRTDIPAYYSEWFFNRIKAGSVKTRNPYYPNQVVQYKLSPDVVDVLSFCTKNPKPMLSRMKEIEKFHQFWFVTITPYGKEIEPNVPDKREVMESLVQLSGIVGINSVGWRYDPIFITEKYSLDYHIEQFEMMAQKLSGHVNQCVISFIDLYEKTKRNFSGVRQVTKEERARIGNEFTTIGKEYGIAIRSCCEGTDLQEYGVDISGCITKEVMERAIGYTLEVPAQKKSPREGCNCLLGNDIGMYNTCAHGCLYCYANYDRKIVLDNIRLHNPHSPFLIAGEQQDDIVKEAKQVPYCSGQMRFEF